ncbi:hypothetical protein [Tranquillimonas rosea]|uniref:hypothetical protein n=1 Tax=Tranquillimonas rosea TaxID=641238 RepID=UPI003BA8E658
MTRAEAYRELQRARQRGDTREISKARENLRRATNDVLRRHQCRPVGLLRRLLGGKGAA